MSTQNSRSWVTGGSGVGPGTAPTNVTLTKLKLRLWLWRAPSRGCPDVPICAHASFRTRSGPRWRPSDRAALPMQVTDSAWRQARPPFGDLEGRGDTRARDLRRRGARARACREACRLPANERAEAAARHRFEALSHGNEGVQVGRPSDWIGGQRRGRSDAATRSVTVLATARWAKAASRHLLRFSVLLFRANSDGSPTVMGCSLSRNAGAREAPTRSP